MLGENAVRRKVAPISSAIECMALLKIANSIESTVIGSPPSPNSCMRPLAHSSQVELRWWRCTQPQLPDHTTGHPTQGVHVGKPCRRTSPEQKSSDMFRSVHEQRLHRAVQKWAS